jgi:hypothetical protein
MKRYPGGGRPRQLPVSRGDPALNQGGSSLKVKFTTISTSLK